MPTEYYLTKADDNCRDHDAVTNDQTNVGNGVNTVSAHGFCICHIGIKIQENYDVPHFYITKYRKLISTIFVKFNWHNVNNSFQQNTARHTQYIISFIRAGCVINGRHDACAEDNG